MAVDPVEVGHCILDHANIPLATFAFCVCGVFSVSATTVGTSRRWSSGVPELKQSPSLAALVLG